MKEEDAKRIMALLADFFKQNDGNKLNKYLTQPLLVQIDQMFGDAFKLNNPEGKPCP